MINKNECAFCWQCLSEKDKAKQICPVTAIHVDEMIECPMNQPTGCCVGGVK